MRVFICSPYRAETAEGIEENTFKALGYCREAVLTGHNPFAPHLFYTYFLDDRIEEERVLGIRCGIEELRRCDEVWVFAKSYEESSSGMKQEILVALSNRIPVVYKL